MLTGTLQPFVIVAVVVVVCSSGWPSNHRLPALDFSLLSAGFTTVSTTPGSQLHFATFYRTEHTRMTFLKQYLIAYICQQL